LITKEIIEKIEGEASVEFEIKDNLVEFATISFPHFRGIEMILNGKNALDALVITPRVCGICGHAHLMASVRAIEDAYKNAGYEIKNNQKIEKIREFTLIMEIIQNHFKWFYMTLIPELEKLHSTSLVQTPLKGAFAASLAAKAIATFAGQWPHSSYMIPGGITSDPTNIDILQVQTYLQELSLFFENETLGTSLEDFLSFESCKEFRGLNSDFSYIEEKLISLEMHEKGFAYDKFLILGKHSFTSVSKLNKTHAVGIDAKFVNTVEAYSPNQITYAKNAQYKKEYYETGPLSRMMALNFPIIKNMHRRFKDSAYSRVMARIFELAYLLKKASSLATTLTIAESSYNSVVDISKITASGLGVVEAPRGPLLHKIEIEKGIIESYKIITPTQFNIGSSSLKNPTPAQKAMQKLSKEEALFVFRTFDVCSVCTTH